jgi:hypothetical protein
VLEVERGKRRLEQRREDVPVPREPLELVDGDDAPAFLDQPWPEVELARNDGAARARDDVGANLRQPALRQIRIAVVERPSDGELEDAVAEELQPLVGVGAVGRPRRVRERGVEQRLRQPRDQRLESARVAGLRDVVTGAT